MLKSVTLDVIGYRKARMGSELNNTLTLYFRCQKNNQDEKCSYFKWADKVQRLSRQHNTNDLANGKVETQSVKKEKTRK